MGMMAERIRNVEEAIDEHAKNESSKKRELPPEDLGEDCPLCKKKADGHSHKLILTDKGTKKCSGKDCGVELGYFDVKKADAVCKDCGHPHRLALHGEDECINCGSTNIDKKW